jgi:hypothetical protein
MHSRWEDLLRDTGIYLTITGFVLVVVLIFGSKAVYSDEPQYLHVASAALEYDWRFPQDTNWVFFGVRHENLAAQTHPPLVEYYLALLAKLFGAFDEVRFRLAFSIFPILAIASFYRLAIRFTEAPFAVTTLFALSPAFFVSAPSIMMDVPMLAFFLAGTAFFFDGQEQPRRLLPAALFFVLAAGTGYVMLVPIGALFVWAVISGRLKRELLALATAPLLMAIWLLAMRAHFGVFPTTELTQYYAAHSSPRQVFLPMFSFIGGAGIFPWIHLPLVQDRRKLILATLSPVIALLATFLRPWPSFEYRLWFIFLASSGLFSVLIFVSHSFPDLAALTISKRTFLFFWFISTVLTLCFFAEMIAARYTLLLLPPLYLVVFQKIKRHAWTGIAIGATGVLSVLLAISDLRFANAYPAVVTRELLPLQQRGFQIWNATEAGPRFYIEQHGITTLAASDLKPRAGELIVRLASCRYSLSSDLEPLLMKIASWKITDSWPIRTFSVEDGTDFHGGLVPFRISSEPIDRLEIDEVSPFVKTLPEVVPSDFSSVPVWFPGGVLLKQVQPEMLFTLQIPSRTKLKYDLEGDASVTVSGNTLVLMKAGSLPVLWKNFQIIPEEWPN